MLNNSKKKYSIKLLLDILIVQRNYCYLRSSAQQSASERVEKRPLSLCSSNASSLCLWHISNRRPNHDCQTSG